VIDCPTCGKSEHGVGHIERGSSFGPWYCRQCGNGFTGRKTEDGSISLTTGERSIKDIACLVEAPAGFRWWTSASLFDGERVSVSHMRFFIEEHQCPINMLRHAVEVPGDPHGALSILAIGEDMEE